MTAEEFAELITKNCLTESGLHSAERALAMTRLGSEFYQDYLKQAEDAQSRWASEKPNREAREKLAKSGWAKSSYGNYYYHAKTKRKASLIEAIRLAKLAE